MDRGARRTVADARRIVPDVMIDENWYEYGDLQMNLRCDVDLARACIAAATAAGVRSKAVDYETFRSTPAPSSRMPSSIPDGRIPAVVAANNVYHDFARTGKAWGYRRGTGACTGKASRR